MSSVSCIGCVFAGSGCAFFVWIYLSDSGEFFFLAVLGTPGPLFRVPFSFFSFLPPSSSPFLSRGRPGFSFLASLPSSPGLPSGSRQVRLSSCLWSVSSFFSLSLGRPPLFLALFSFSFFSLSLSFSCMHATYSDIPPVLLAFP